MYYFPKIYAPFSRDSDKDRLVNTDKWSKPEFKMLSDIEWQWSEKIDGQCVALEWDGDKVTIHGHTDKSELYPTVKEWLEKKFLTPEAETVFETLYQDKKVLICGEGISRQTNLNYGFIYGSFIPFDIYNQETRCWWTRDSVEKFSQLFNLTMAKTLFTGSIFDAVEYVKTQPFSTLDSSVIMEGVVGRPVIEIKAGNGDRIITKVKTRDFV